MPQTNTKAKILYVVLPLTDKKPFITADEAVCKAQNCVYIELDLLISLQKTFAKEQFYIGVTSFQNHCYTNQKISLRDMGEFGQGAFSNAPILAKEALVYSGKIVGIKKANLEDLHLMRYPEQIQDGENNFVIDGNKASGKTQYFQHLPNENPFTTENEDIVLANFQQVPALYKFTLTSNAHKINQQFIIPLAILRAEKDIPANTLVGYDYGDNYWRTLNIFPSYFSHSGVVQTTYILSGKNADGIIELTATKKVLCDIGHTRYIDNDTEIYIFPGENVSILKEYLLKTIKGTIKIDLPMIAELKNFERGLYKNVDVLTFPLANFSAPKDPLILSIFEGTTKKDGALFAIFTLDSIIQASREGLIKLAEYLHLGNPNKKLVNIFQTPQIPHYAIFPEQPLPIFSLEKHSIFKTLADNFSKPSMVLEIANMRRGNHA